MMKRNVFQDGNDSGLVMIEGLGEYASMEQVAELKSEIARLQAQNKNLYQEAVIHAHEARAQRSTVHDIYQALGIQKGNWNGKVPVAEKFAEIEHQRDKALTDADQWSAAHDKLEQECDQLKAQWARFNSIMGEIHIECGTGDDYAGDPIPGELWQLWRSPETSLAAHDADVIERALSDDKVREAMQLIWNDHTSDTGCFPDDFSIKSDGLLYFTAGHYFADRVASQLRHQAQEQ